MPTYEYRCPACGNEREVERSMDERRDSPSCSCGDEMELQVSLPRPGRVVGDENRPWHR